MDSMYRIVYCTVPDATSGAHLAKTLVEEGLCACVNRIASVTSHYIYEDEYCEETEELLLIKTKAEAFGRLKSRIEELHPYDVPEIISVPIAEGNESYLRWLDACVK